MTYVIVGASTGLGRALATRFAAAGHDLIIVSSDARDIDATAADLRIRYGRRVIPVAADITASGPYLASLHRAVAALGELDGLLLPVGAVRDDDEGGLDAASAEWIIRVNFSAVAATVTALMPYLQTRGRGTIVGFGSIAAARGRSTNIIYAAAKRGLASFFESLRHRCAGTGVVVQFYVLGYLDTALAYGRPTPVRPASPARLSEHVLRRLGRDVGVVYYPRRWRWLTAVLGLLPWALFKRLRF